MARMIPHVRQLAIVAFVAAVVFDLAPSPLFAQIIFDEEYRGQRISCALSGLRGWGSPCGTGGGYTDIFMGSILSVTELLNTERVLLVRPEEVFLGNPAGDLTVTTTQGACFEAVDHSQLEPGDRWLFYLDSEDKSKKLLLQFGRGSGRATNALEAISLLRKLVKMRDTGVIKGAVMAPHWDGQAWENYAPVPNHKVILKRDDGSTEFKAITDKEGNYEFEPLPVGNYNITPNTAIGLWDGDGPVRVSAGSCEEFRFELKPDGRISGQVTTADGKPVPYASVDAVKALRDHGADLVSTTSDESGYFEIKGLEPASYFVGIGIGKQHDSPEWRSRVYYPGVRTEGLAVRIDLGKAEKRADIDIRIPNPPAQ